MSDPTRVLATLDRFPTNCAGMHVVGLERADGSRSMSSPTAVGPVISGDVIALFLLPATLAKEPTR